MRYDIYVVVWPMKRTSEDVVSIRPMIHYMRAGNAKRDAMRICEIVTREE